MRGPDAGAASATTGAGSDAASVSCSNITIGDVSSSAGNSTSGSSARVMSNVEVSSGSGVAGTGFGRATFTIRLRSTFTFCAVGSQASSPAASLSATAMMPAMSAFGAPSPRSAPSMCGSAATAWSSSASTGAFDWIDLSSTRFSMFSTFQLNSPSAIAPTSRPEPLSVWNERRTGLSFSRSETSRFHAGSCRLRLSISSWTSSTNTSRISSSMSSEGTAWNSAALSVDSGAASSSTSSSISTQSYSTSSALGSETGVVRSVSAKRRPAISDAGGGGETASRAAWPIIRSDTSLPGAISTILSSSCAWAGSTCVGVATGPLACSPRSMRAMNSSRLSLGISMLGMSSVSPSATSLFSERAPLAVCVANDSPPRSTCTSLKSGSLRGAGAGAGDAATGARAAGAGAAAGTCSRAASPRSSSSLLAGMPVSSGIGQ